MKPIPDTPETQETRQEPCGRIGELSGRACSRPKGHDGWHVHDSSSPREPQKDETPDAAELLLSLGRIHIAARRALSFGRQATPQTLERMLERRDETLTQIVGACEDAGVKKPSILRAESGEPREPHAAWNAQELIEETRASERVTPSDLNLRVTGEPHAALVAQAFEMGWNAAGSDYEAALERCLLALKGD